MFGIDDAIGGLFDLGETRMQNVANAKEATKNRDFQKSMSDSAHQREVADMIAAGINPILSGTGGPGASTPSGATPRIERSHAFSAMQESRATRTQAENVAAQTDNVKADTANKKQQTANLFQDQMKTRQDTIESMARVRQLGLQGPQTEAQTENIKQATQESIEKTTGIKISNDQAGLAYQLLQAEMPGRLDQAKVDASASAHQYRRAELTKKLIDLGITANAAGAIIDNWDKIKKGAESGAVTIKKFVNKPLPKGVELPAPDTAF